MGRREPVRVVGSDRRESMRQVLAEVAFERIERARGQYRRCMLCECRCGVDRLGGEVGECKAGAWPRLFRHRIECGEEVELVPSHEFYLSGCDLRCAFCIAGVNAFDPARGRELTQGWFNELVDWGVAQGARNIQWVGGEPTIHLPALLELMAGCERLPEVVWKSDFHCTTEALELLEGVADIYVADFKFGNDGCAKRLAGCRDYVGVVTRNLEWVVRRGGRLIVRHLLMPGHLECCFRPVARWMRERLPGVGFSLREGYLPSWRAGAFVELGTPVGRGEVVEARRYVEEVGLRVIR